MLAVISRFSTHTSALQFEWALQHPAASLAVRASVRGKPGLGTARSVKSKFAVANIMTSLEQWSDEDLLLHFTTDEAKELWISATREQNKTISATAAAPTSFGVSSSTLGPLKSLWLYVDAERLLAAAKKKKKEASEALKIEKKETKRRAREEAKSVGRKRDGKGEKNKMAKLNSYGVDGPAEDGEEDLMAVQLGSDDETKVSIDGTNDDLDGNDILVIDVDDFDDDASINDVISLDGSEKRSTLHASSSSVVQSGEGGKGGGGGGDGLTSIGKENDQVNRVTIIIDDDDDAVEETEVFEVDDNSSADEGDDDDDGDTKLNGIKQLEGVSLDDDDGDDESLPLPLVDRLKRRLQSSPSSLSPSSSSSPCGLCFLPVLPRQREPFLQCKGCSSHFHLFCAADHFLTHQRRTMKRSTLSSSLVSSTVAAPMPIVPSDSPIPCPGLVMIIGDDGKGEDKAHETKYRTSSCSSSLVWSQAIVDASSSSSLASPSALDTSSAGLAELSSPLSNDKRASSSKRKSVTFVINKNKIG